MIVQAEDTASRELLELHLKAEIGSGACEVLKMNHSELEVILVQDRDKSAIVTNPPPEQEIPNSEHSRFLNLMRGVQSQITLVVPADKADSWRSKLPKANIVTVEVSEMGKVHLKVLDTVRRYSQH